MKIQLFAVLAALFTLSTATSQAQETNRLPVICSYSVATGDGTPVASASDVRLELEIGVAVEKALILADLLGAAKIKVYSPFNIAAPVISIRLEADGTSVEAMTLAERVGGMAVLKSEGADYKLTAACGIASE